MQKILFTIREEIKSSNPETKLAFNKIVKHFIELNKERKKLKEFKKSLNSEKLENIKKILNKYFGDKVLGFCFTLQGLGGGTPTIKIIPKQKEGFKNIDYDSDLFKSEIGQFGIRGYLLLEVPKKERADYLM